MAVMMVAAVPATADDVEQWRPLIAEASARFGVPASWIERVMRAESRGHARLNGRPIRSVKGAMGLMQLMPGTWAELRDELDLGSDPDNPRDNILAGTFYLRRLYDRFGYPGLFAAYNAGPGRYMEYLDGRSLPAETQAYLAAMGVLQDEPAKPPVPRLFAVRAGQTEPAEPEQSAPPLDPLFAVRRDAR